MNFGINSHVVGFQSGKTVTANNEKLPKKHNDSLDFTVCSTETFGLLI